MTTLAPVRPGTRGSGPPVAAPAPLRGTRLVGHLFVWTSGIHVGIVAAGTGQYRSFADAAVPFVHDAWRDVFMAHPAVWGLLVALGELVIGVLVLRGGRATRLGLSGALLFTACLQLFGWGFALWCLPFGALLAALLRREVEHGR